MLTIASSISAAGFLWPFFSDAHSPARGLNNQLFYWIAVPIALAVLIVEISNARLDAKSVALLGVLTALTAALRPMGAGAIGIEPIWFILILAARVFGSAFGFILGILALFLSAFLTGGFGPWLAYQMFAAGWIGLGAGALPQRIGKFALRGKSEIALLLAYAIFAAMLFGLLMDLQFWPWAVGTQTQLSYLPDAAMAENFHRFILFHFASSMAWDIPRAIFTFALIFTTGPAILFALRRTKRRASFLTPIEFLSAAQLAIARAKARREV
jgi:energy-coupling factor transport system substrate-specific component